MFKKLWAYSEATEEMPEARTVSSLRVTLNWPDMAIPMHALRRQQTPKLSTLLCWTNIHSYLVCLNVICLQVFFILGSTGEIPPPVSKHPPISAGLRLCESSCMGPGSYAFHRNNNNNNGAGTFFHLGQRYKNFSCPRLFHEALSVVNKSLKVLSSLSGFNNQALSHIIES